MSQPLDGSSFINKSSDELILLALEGNEEAFTTLYNRYTPELSRYLGGLVKNWEDRDELVVETFVKAWQKLPQLQYKDRFRPWLYRIATNLAYDHRRREKLHQWLHLEAFDDLVCLNTFEIVIEETELAKLALQEVPWKYRTCLLLYVEGKFSKQEIAEVVKISPKSVQSYISFGREYLRKAYRRLENDMRER
jgi:RNA polymerase sigma-70 factor (ECF subfamily)